MILIDIYFEPNYGKLYEEIEDGEAVFFHHKSKLGEIYHSFIKRKITEKVNGIQYYDITTPYGYGGPVIKKVSNGASKSELVEDFYKEFSLYCEQNNIVSEFVRFHPLFENQLDFDSLYDVQFMRKTVGTNLKDYENPFQEEFSKSCRKNVRKAIKNGITYKVTDKPTDVEKFLEIYFSTMDRNNANDYYYFDDKYFENAIDYFSGNVVIVEAIYQKDTIAMGFYFKYEKYIHIHLSGTLTEFIKLSPAYILRFGIVEWGKENGYEYIHHGGGRSNDPTDSLYKFKKQFGKNTDFYFYIGKKIWNNDVYEKLCDKLNVNSDTEFFPAYRSV